MGKKSKEIFMMLTNKVKTETSVLEEALKPLPEEQRI